MENKEVVNQEGKVSVLDVSGLQMHEHAETDHSSPSAAHGGKNRRSCLCLFTLL